MNQLTKALFKMVELEGYCQLAKAQLALGKTHLFIENIQNIEDKLFEFKIEFVNEIKCEIFLATEEKNNKNE